MTYRFLGKTGVKVSTIAYGTMSFGGDADEAGSKALFGACREAGVNHFDCADMYAGGRSEEILGRLIKDCREEVIITSKAYFATSKDVNAMGASRRHIQFAVEASLRRLQTDRIDIYYIHRFDDRTALEETLRALDDLVRQGKVVYLGASNFAAWQVAKALGISAKEGLAPFACIQPMYNLVKRQAESEILPMAQSEGLGVFPYNALGGGLLSGKYGPGQKPAERTDRHQQYLFRPLWQRCVNFEWPAGSRPSPGSAAMTRPDWPSPGWPRTRRSPRPSSGPGARPSSRPCSRRPTSL